jgi:hypothetical protein
MNFLMNARKLFQVGSDWTSNENILGLPRWTKCEVLTIPTPILDLVLRAELKADLPHFPDSLMR